MKLINYFRSFTYCTICFLYFFKQLIKYSKQREYASLNIEIFGK